MQTVVVKATYVLWPGTCVLAAEQDALNEEDKHWNNDPTQSVYAPSDMVPFKPKADVMLVGHAFSHGKQQVRSLMARLVVGEINKSIEVWCDRRFRLQDGQLLEGPRFTTMPLRWERAAGGPGTINPVGMRFDAAPDMYGTVTIPNLQPPGHFVSERKDAFAPVCFAPIASRWPARMWALGRHAEALAAGRWTDRPLPEDLDYVYFQASPTDQQAREIRANESIVLECLHPDYPRLMTSLPGVRPRAVAERATGEREEIALRADTLWISADRGTCAVTWRGRLGLRHAGETGRITVSVEGGAALEAPVPVRERERLVAGPTSVSEVDVLDESDAAVMTMAASMVETGPVTPFVEGGGGAVVPASRRAGSRSSDGALPFRPTAEAMAPGPPSLSRPADGTQFAPTSKAEEKEGTSFPPAGPPPVAAPSQLFNPPPMINPPPMVTMPPRLQPIAPAMETSSWASGPVDHPAKLSIGQRMLAHEVTQNPSPVQNTGALSPAVEDRIPKRRWKTSTADSTSSVREAGPVSPAFVPMDTVAVSTTATEAQANHGAGAVSGSRMEAPSGATPKEVLELLWFDPTFVPRVRRNPAWKEIMVQVKPTPLDDDFPGEAPPDKRQELRDRREVFGLLARAKPIEAFGINGVLADAVREDGTFAPPIVLVRGELEFPFDELETLKATIAAITPLTTGDKRLKEAVETTEELLRTPWLMGASSVTEGLTAKLKEAFAQGNRMLPARYLETHTARILLEQRAYQKRTVLGKPCIRSLLTLTGAQAPVPAYLPESLGPDLPSFQRFTVRMLAQVCVQLDQYEEQSVSLRAVGIGRVLSGLQPGNAWRP